MSDEAGPLRGCAKLATATTMGDALPLSIGTTPPPLVVSYYTPSYAEEAAGLRDSLDAHGIAHRLVAEPSRGSWEKNCARKASFLRDLLGEPELRDRGIVWLDADARVRRPLGELWALARCVHVAAHWRDGVEMLSGTLALRGEPARALCEMWALACECHPEEWDQRVLASVVHVLPGLVLGVLPAPYCWIETWMPEVPRALVAIEHRQASRRLRDAEESHPVDDLPREVRAARDSDVPPLEVAGCAG